MNLSIFYDFIIFFLNKVLTLTLKIFSEHLSFVPPIETDEEPYKVSLGRGFQDFMIANWMDLIVYNVV